MKYSKSLLLLFSVLLSFSVDLNAQQQTTPPACGMPDNLLDDPRIEAAYRQFIEKTNHLAKGKVTGLSSEKTSQNPNASKFVIPCVIHVCYENRSDSISYAQVFSQFVAMYNDFRKVPGTRGFGGGVDTEIEFNLATKDPRGNPTNGIVYHKVSSEWINLPQDNNVEFKTKIAPGWNPQKYFNIWLTRTIKDDGSFGQLAGYAQFPDPALRWGGQSDATDGVVCIAKNFGTTGTSGAYSATMSHEIGHWLWLFHTFQGGCPNAGQSCSTTGDRICDTPPVKTPQFKNPNVRLNTCRETPYDFPDNPRNFMDYTNPDNGCNVFTAGQKEMFFRTLQNDEWKHRYNLWQESNLEATGTGKFSRPVGNFWAEPRVSCVTNPIRFLDYTMGSATSWKWEFPGGTPATSTEASPIVTYDKEGEYTVRLIVTNESGIVDTVVKENFISVYDNKIPVTVDSTFVQDFSLRSTRDFPPPGWRVENPDAGFLGGSSWRMSRQFNSFDRTGDPGVALINYYSYNQYNQFDGLVLPPLDISKLTTPTLYFDYAYTPLAYSKTKDTGEQNPPFTQNLSLALPTEYTDTLQIKVSTDCGKNWEVIWKKGGRELRTRDIMRSNDEGQNGEFSTPVKADWDSLGVDLAKYKSQNNVLIKFEGISGYGNNLYLDRVRLNNTPFTSVRDYFNLLDFSVYPNPTDETTSVQFTLKNSASVGYQLLDIQGRTIRQKGPSVLNSGLNKIDLNLSGQTEGVYLMKIDVNGKISTQKIIKY